MVPPFLYSSPIPLLPGDSVLKVKGGSWAGEQRQWLSTELSTLVPFYPVASPFAAYHSPWVPQETLLSHFYFLSIISLIPGKLDAQSSQKTTLPPPVEVTKATNTRRDRVGKKSSALHPNSSVQSYTSSSGKPSMTPSLSCQCTS